MKTRRQSLFVSIFIAITMVGSMIGFATMRAMPEGGKRIELPVVVNKILTPQEKIAALKSGKVIIEFIYPENCTTCAGKLDMYEKFVNSKEFKGYVILSYSTSENETADWMLNLNGDQINLSSINDTQSLKKMFCKKAIIKPDVCILEEV